MSIRDAITAELTYRTSRSSGPGGQHVNKTETRVEAVFDLCASSALDEDQKARVRKKLGRRVSVAGIVAVGRSRHRSQAANKKSAAEHLLNIVEDALKEQKVRKSTEATSASRQRKAQAKKIRSEVKRARQRPKFESE